MSTEDLPGRAVAVVLALVLAAGVFAFGVLLNGALDATVGVFR